MKITRKRLKNNTLQSESKTVEIAVKPGWKSGTKITFQGDGDEDEMRSAGDVVFKIAEKPHSVYTRSDNDLIYTLRLPLRDVSLGLVIVSASLTFSFEAQIISFWFYEFLFSVFHFDCFDFSQRFIYYNSTIAVN